MSVTKILIVDDSSTIRTVISKYLGDAYTVIFAHNGEEAWELIKADNTIALVFADMHMPVMNGMLLLKIIRDSDDSHISNLPVVMITGHQDSEAAKQASFNMGATDFISKPFSEIDIVSRAKSYTELNQKIAELEQNVTHDSLTGLLNEQGFREITNKTIASAYRHELELSLLSIQIKSIEVIIDQYDKNIVDQMIKNIATNLQKSLRKEEFLAYNGNGNFSALLPMTKAFKAHLVALRFQSAIAKITFAIGDKKVTMKLAIGLTSTEININPVNSDELKTQAEQALNASLRNLNCKVMRYDELNLKNLQNEKNSADEVALKVSTLPAVPLANEDVEVVTKPTFNTDGDYFAQILDGEFEQIPKIKVVDMIQPLEAFLAYAKNQIGIQSGIENNLLKAENQTDRINLE